VSDRGNIRTKFNFCAEFAERVQSSILADGCSKRTQSTQEKIKARHDKTYHGAFADSFVDAAIFAGVAVLATPWDTVRE
jgi:hypothetical protein